MLERASDAVRGRLSMPTRRSIAEKRVQARGYTARLRVLPDFLIIGAQRSGTSSVYRYLGAHPDLIASVRKETQYFTKRYNEGPEWYRAHFPLAMRVGLQSRLRRPAKTFEATPDYLFHPLAAGRVRLALPNARFIVLLRDPVERAFSHYKHMHRLGLEELTFEQALDAEDGRISPDLDQLKRDPYHPCVFALRFSYAIRGMYAEQLERWFAEFGRDQFLIIDAQDLFQDERGILASICSFIGVGDWAPDHFRNYSSPGSRGRPALTEQLNDTTRQRLRTRYEPENERLEKLTGRSFSWTTA